MVSLRINLVAQAVRELFARKAREWTRKRFVLLAMVVAFSGPFAASAAEVNQLLSNWLSSQTNLHSWSADVVQTRTLKALSQPLTARGRVWFMEPNLFRWELGEPAQTIAVRQPAEMLVIYPRLKRAERYPLDGNTAGPWRDALTLLEAGFPRNQADLEARFKIVSVTNSGDTGEVALQPKSAAARRMMPEIKITFGLKDASLRATELKFADGSTMRNEFTNAVWNPKIEATTFYPPMAADIKVVEPLRGAGK